MNCLIYLVDGFELFELSSFTDVFGWFNVLFKDRIMFHTLSYKKLVKAMWGGYFEVEKLATEINLADYDILIIPGGFGSGGYFQENSEEEAIFKNILKHFIDEDKKIVSVCTASLKILKTGLIADEELAMTTYMLENKRYSKQLENYKIKAVYDEIVVSKNFISCSGPSNALAVAFLLIEENFGVDKLNKLKENMMFKS